MSKRCTSSVERHLQKQTMLFSLSPEFENANSPRDLSPPLELFAWRLLGPPLDLHLIDKLHKDRRLVENGPCHARGELVALLVPRGDGQDPLPAAGWADGTRPRRSVTASASSNLSFPHWTPHRPRLCPQNRTKSI